jgi:hypothetical protein
MYSFTCWGHPNILGTHATTLEFTKDKEVSLKGDCIIGLSATFDTEKLLAWLKGRENIRVLMKVDDMQEELTCLINPEFTSSREIVIRKSEFVSERTLGIRATRSCADLPREFVDKLKNSKAEMNVEFS